MKLSRVDDVLDKPAGQGLQMARARPNPSAVAGLAGRRPASPSAAAVGAWPVQPPAASRRSHRHEPERAAVSRAKQVPSNPKRFPVYFRCGGTMAPNLLLP